VVLSAFNSLDDALSIDDLAAALEERVATLETGGVLPGWKTSQSAVICHSTGALVVRRWLLNRYFSGKLV
jgi:alpha-beta hydrolase superfamily lysophospholipase